MICASETDRKGRARSRIPVVRSDTHPIQRSWHKGQSLLPTRFKTCDMSVRPVCGSVLGKSGVGLTGGNGGIYKKYRIRQVLVEYPALNDAHPFEVMFEKKVEILSMGRFEVWITRRDRHVGIGRVVHKK